MSLLLGSTRALNPPGEALQAREVDSGKTLPRPAGAEALRFKETRRRGDIFKSSPAAKGSASSGGNGANRSASLGRCPINRRRPSRFFLASPNEALPYFWSLARRNEALQLWNPG